MILDLIKFHLINSKLKYFYFNHFSILFYLVQIIQFFNFINIHYLLSLLSLYFRLLKYSSLLFFLLMLFFHLQIFHIDIFLMIFLTPEVLKNFVMDHYILIYHYPAKIFLIFHLKLIIHLKMATNFLHFLNYNQEAPGHPQFKYWPKYYLIQQKTIIFLMDKLDHLVISSFQKNCYFQKQILRFILLYHNYSILLFQGSKVQ